MGWPPVRQARRCRNARRGRVHAAEPLGGESTMRLASGGILHPASVLEEEPTERAVLHKPVVVEGSDGKVRQDLLVDGTLGQRGRGLAMLGDDRRAPQPHAWEPVDGRLLVAQDGAALGPGQARPELLPGLNRPLAWQVGPQHLAKYR